LYLGESPAYDIDLSRLDKLARRTIKGLFYHEAGKRLADEYFAQAFSAAGLVNLTREKQVQVKRTVDLLLNRQFREVGKREVFGYWYLASTDDLPSQVAVHLYGRLGGGLSSLWTRLLGGIFGGGFRRLEKPGEIQLPTSPLLDAIVALTR
jgi:hypothetical protein